MLKRLGSFQEVRKPQNRISPDGIPYVSREFRHTTGGKLEMNTDEYGPHHIRINGAHTFPNLDEMGVIEKIVRFFGRR